MNKTFGDFFSPFFSMENLPETLVQGVIEALEVDAKSRSVAARVAIK